MGRAWLLLLLSRAFATDNASAVRDETVELPFGYNVTVEVPLQDEGIHVPTPLMCAMAVLFFGSLACTCCICFGLSIFEGREAPLALRKGYERFGTEDAAAREQLRDRLLLEGYLALGVPWVSLALGSLWLLAFHGQPPLLLLLALAAPAVGRAVYLEYQLASERPLRIAPAFVLSKFELLDAASDGLAIVAAAAMPELAHRRFAKSVAELPVLQTLMRTAGLPGTLAAALAYATFIQSLMLSLSLKEPCIGADIAGLGALANTLETDRGVRLLWVGLSRVLGEAAPQLLLQSSVLMASGHSLLTDQPAVLASVLLSTAMLLKKAYEMGRSGVERAMEAPDRGLLVQTLLFTMATVAPLLGVCCLVAVKLYMIEACPDRLWGLSTGCVSM